MGTDGTGDGFGAREHTDLVHAVWLDRRRGHRRRDGHRRNDPRSDRLGVMSAGREASFNVLDANPVKTSGTRDASAVST